MRHIVGKIEYSENIKPSLLKLADLVKIVSFKLSDSSTLLLAIIVMVVIKLKSCRCGCLVWNVADKKTS